MKEIAYLHLSDLHIGDTLQKTILSRIRDEIKEDIAYIVGKLGRLDFLFFSGDLVQSGSKEEYAQFSEFLDEILLLLKEKGFTPKVLFVPGNHDLQRITDTDNPTHQMMKGWMGNKDLREDMFWKDNSSYIQYVNERFLNYSSFIQQFNTKQGVAIEQGVLPGDYYYQIKIDEISLGLVGLNSSFLQVEGGDYRQKLGIYNTQVYGIFGDRFIEKLKQNDINLLMTHHAPAWYETGAKEEYEQEIYSPDLFFEHLCGHNHNSQTIYTNENYTGERRVSIAPSLCGLEKIEGGIDRIHGYQAGKFIFNDDGSIEKEFYPRLASKRSNGYSIDKDFCYQYTKGEESIRFTLKLGNSSEELDTRNEQMLLESSASNATFIHPSALKDSSWYQNVRTEQQQLAIELLDKLRYVWIVSHYLLGEEQFISSVLRQKSIDLDSVFVVNCEDVANIDQFDNQIRERFSVSLSKLVMDLCKTVQRPVLIFKNIQNDFLKNDLAQLWRTILSVANFSENLYILLVSSIKPSANYFESIELQPLKQEDVNKCITEALPQEKFTAFDFEKIYNITNGYPLCIDILCRKLRYLSLDDLDESDFSLYRNDLPIPGATTEYINSIRNSSNVSERNCYNLLLLMSLLPKGDMFTTIRRFNSTSPFKGEELDSLVSRELLTVEHYYIIKNNELIKQPKVLRIPKIYRDYVLSIEKKETLRQINYQICTLYLGEKWHQYNVKLKKTGMDEYFPFTYYNVESALKYLLQYAAESDDNDGYVKYLTIAGNYLNKLESDDIYYVALYVANDLYQFIQTVPLIDNAKTPLSYFKFKLANLERMNGHHDRCVSLFNEVLEENLLSSSRLQSCRECMAYTFTKKGESEKAIHYADEMLANEKNKHNSVNVVIAKYIKAVNTSDLGEKLKQLKTVYKSAVKFKNAAEISTNIALDISIYSKDKETIKMLDAEIKRNTSKYQWMLLLVRKYSLYSDSKLQLSLDEKDIHAVKIVYAYAFMQMLESIMSDSHDILWDYYSSRKEYEEIVSFLRYSFFVWDMCSKPDKIENCLTAIKSDSEFMNWIQSNQTNENVVSLIRERKILK